MQINRAKMFEETAIHTLEIDTKDFMYWRDSSMDDPEDVLALLRHIENGNWANTNGSEIHPDLLCGMPVEPGRTDNDGDFRAIRVLSEIRGAAV